MSPWLGEHVEGGRIGLPSVRRACVNLSREREWEFPCSSGYFGREISSLWGFQEHIASLFAFGGFNGFFENPSLEVGVIKRSSVLGTSCVPNPLGPTVKTADAYLTVLAPSVTYMKDGLCLIEDGEPSLEQKSGDFHS